MTQPDNLTGKTFGLLRVIEKAENIKHRNTFWRCVCVCDTVIYVSGTNLRHGYTTSCGCDPKEGK